MAVLLRLEKVEEVVVKVKGFVSTGSGEDRLVGDVCKSEYMRIAKLKDTASTETWTVTRAKCDFNLENLRVLLLLKAMSGRQYFADVPCRINTEIYSILFKVSKEQTVLDFEKALEELVNLEITPRGEDSFTGWITGYEFLEPDKVRFFWNPKVKELAEQDSAFGSYRVYHLKGITTVLGLKLFRYLNTVAVYKEHCTYTSTLVDILGIENFTGKSKELKHLLLPAVEEINKSTTLYISSITNTGKGLAFKMQRKSYVQK